MNDEQQQQQQQLEESRFRQFASYNPVALKDQKVVTMPLEVCQWVRLHHEKEKQKALADQIDYQIKLLDVPVAQFMCNVPNLEFSIQSPTKTEIDLFGKPGKIRYVKKITKVGSCNQTHLKDVAKQFFLEAGQDETNALKFAVELVARTWSQLKDKEEWVLKRTQTTASAYDDSETLNNRQKNKRNLSAMMLLDGGGGGGGRNASSATTATKTETRNTLKQMMPIPLENMIPNTAEENSEFSQ